MKKITLIAIVLFTVNLSYSQDAQPDSTMGDHYVGLNIGSSTGIGFSYKFVKKRVGIQLSGIPIYNDGNLWASAGMGLTLRSKRSIMEDQDFRPLLYWGASVIGSGGNDLGLDFASTAVGFGFDYKFDKRFTFNIMAGYGLYFANNVNTSISGEMGLHYRL